MKYHITIYKFSSLFIFKPKKITPSISNYNLINFIAKILKLVLPKSTPFSINDSHDNIIDWINPWIVNTEIKQEPYHEVQESIMNMSDDMFYHSKKRLNKSINRNGK